MGELCASEGGARTMMWLIGWVSDSPFEFELFVNSLEESLKCLLTLPLRDKFNLKLLLQYETSTTDEMLSYLKS